MERKYSFAEDEAGLFDFAEPEVEVDPVPRATIALSGINVSAFIARVDRINVDGLHRTKDDVIKGTVDDLFKAKDFEDVIVRAHKVTTHLAHATAICRREAAERVRSRGARGGRVQRRPSALQRHAPRVHEAAAAATVPPRSDRVVASGWCRVSGSLYQRDTEQPSSGYRLLNRGLLLDLAFQTSPTCGRVMLRHEWVGSTGVIPRPASQKTGVKQQRCVSPCPQLKSMVRHIICVDQRDEAVFPTRGVRLQISNELAGLGGSVASLKAELHLQLNHTLSDTLGVVVQATCAMGLLQDVYGTELADHFFLGGPSSLRGFQHRGVGPHCDGQALGGRMYWAGGLHVVAPLPVAGARRGLAALLRSHLFLNAGCLAFPERGSGGAAWWRGLGAARGAAGAGLSVKLGRATRLDLSYVLPLRWMPGDRTHAGLQFGLGANLL
ncbi:unnamed protein product [Spodoptera exigua]|nr:unnamed protein product [Spodoptera exigua]